MNQPCVDGEVHSFEIDDKFVEAINSSLERNGTNAHVVKKAVSDKSTNLNYTDGLVPNISDTGGENEVESITLDKYAEEHPLPDVMKIDVEGFEYNVLSGSEEVFQMGKPDILFVEVHPEMLENYDSSASEVLSFLKRHGFNCEMFSDHRGESANTSELTLDDISGNTMLECRI